jgi:hypothetical protein
VTVVQNYTWNGPHAFRIVEGGAVTGTFATELWAGQPNAGDYTVTYGPNYVDITVIAPPAGSVISIR